jgi:hypothetical protein
VLGLVPEDEAEGDSKAEDHPDGQAGDEVERGGSGADARARTRASDGEAEERNDPEHAARDKDPKDEVVHVELSIKLQAGEQQRASVTVAANC